MTGITKSTCVVLMAVALVAAISPQSEAAIGCGTVVTYLQPCLPYVTNQGSLGNCCSGIKKLIAAAPTKPERQSVCNCLKSLSGSLKGIDYNKVGKLPGQCGVSLPYKISPSTDCSKVS